MTPTYLMLLWHMHQPFYQDLVGGTCTMSWVRLHALKDYYGMVAILREFPSVHVTFNLVPSLMVQLQEYAREVARDSACEIAFKPVVKLTAEERESLVTDAFQTNRENLINRYPRFRELFEKAGPAENRAGARFFTSQDLLDLQVLSQLAWFDEIYLTNDRDVKGLVAKEQWYTEQDKSLIRRKESEILNKVLEEYREARECGQIEISTSPFYHPILPLLCDTDVALEAHPGIRLPSRRFSHPDDAHDQLREAIALHRRVFGAPPLGLWPSEGSVSDEVLRLAAEEGFRWAATDEGVLARTLQMNFSRQANGTVSGGQELYRPHRFSDRYRQITLFFRDQQISNLIGFVYSRMDPEAAAADLHQRIRAAGRSAGQRPAVVSIILDGENPWEFYPGNGRQFLKAFYGRVASDPELRAVTASEAIGLTEPGTLTHVVPGSWINANFDIWIGAEEDNRAWDLLSDARDFFVENNRKAAVPREKARLAQQEVWIAEGSDWCWWYGPEHSTANDEEFDLLFRKHLSNVYRLLDGSPPDELAIPIKRPKTRARHVPPTGRIEPRVDGHVTNYFEWLGAGVYTPDYPIGSMHGGARYVEAFYYGYSDDALYLRLDLKESFLKIHSGFEIRVTVGGEGKARVHATIAQGVPIQAQVWKDEESVPIQASAGKQVEVAFGQIFELRVDRTLLGLSTGERIQFQASLWANALPVQAIPQEGWLTLELTEHLASW